MYPRSFLLRKRVSPLDFNVSRNAVEQMIRSSDCEWWPPLMEEQEWFTVRRPLDSHSFVLDHVFESLYWPDSFLWSFKFFVERPGVSVSFDNQGHEHVLRRVTLSREQKGKTHYVVSSNTIPAREFVLPGLFKFSVAGFPPQVVLPNQGD